MFDGGMGERACLRRVVWWSWTQDVYAGSRDSTEGDEERCRS